MCTVMLVEDNEAIRLALADVLGWEGYAVVACHHGEDARARLEAGAAPCIIVLDLLMPVMDGWSFLDWIETSPYRGMPIVLLTSLGLDAEVIEQACHRRCRVLPKSGDLRDLIAEVGRACPAHLGCAPAEALTH